MLGPLPLITVFLSLLTCSCSESQPLTTKPTFTPDQQLVIASFQLDVERVNSLLGNGANSNARLGVNDEHLFEDKWTLAYSPIASDKWTPLLALANSHRAPQPIHPTENTGEALDHAMEKLKAIDPKIIQERDKQRVAIAKLLIAKQANLDLDDGYGSTALSYSIYFGFDSLSLLLIESGANPNTKTGIYIDGTGDITPLHRATESPTILKALLKHGALVAVKDGLGATPLHWAAREPRAECVQLLIAAGADVNAKDKEGVTALNWTHTSDLFEFPDADDAEKKKIAKLLRDAGAK